jgi:nucleolar protein 12
MEVDGASEASSDEDNETEAARLIERAVTQGKSSEDGDRRRKRKRKDEDEKLEATYLERLAAEDEPSGKRRKSKDNKPGDGEQNGDKDVQKEDGEGDDESLGEPPVHESLTAAPALAELEKANRTVFLSNVSVEAITSRKAKKTLLRHLASVLDKEADPPQKIESIRFRSTAFESAGIPKRAAYIKKEVMAATTKSTNAYVVYSTQAAARLAVSKLNGTIVLDRHLRADSVAHPAPIDHRRCVFVGNLGFVDDESVYTTKVDEEGKEVTTKRKRTKEPMDVEEGLWRVFGEKAGKVENVRVVRDPATRVGKGFAYVQFYVSSPAHQPLLTAHI